MQQLSHKYLKSPAFIDLVGEDDVKIPSTIEHWSYATQRETRADILGLVASVHGSKKRSIVFTQASFFFANNLSIYIVNRIVCVLFSVVSSFCLLLVSLHVSVSCFRLSCFLFFAHFHPSLETKKKTLGTCFTVLEIASSFSFRWFVCFVLFFLSMYDIVQH